jgi:hypothetical protein
MPVPDHAAHDQVLVAVYAAGDASGAELARAAALVATCPECAALHRDLRSISSALATAPAPVRPRDFRITADQAAELARPAGWRRWLAPFSQGRAAGPLAASLAALGMAGLLLGGGVNLGLSGATSTAALAPQAASTSGDTAFSGAESSGSTAAGGGQVTNGAAADASAAASQELAMPSAAASAAASVAPAAQPTAAPSTAASIAPSQMAAVATNAPAPSAPFVPQTSDKNASSGGTAAEATAPASTDGANFAPSRPSPTAVPQAAAPGTPAGPSLIVLGSLVLLVAGVVLGLLRMAARRLV